jgi:hypothetical protein
LPELRPVRNRQAGGLFDRLFGLKSLYDGFFNRFLGCAQNDPKQVENKKAKAGGKKF